MCSGPGCVELAGGTPAPAAGPCPGPQSPATGAGRPAPHLLCPPGGLESCSLTCWARLL